VSVARSAPEREVGRAPNRAEAGRLSEDHAAQGRSTPRTLTPGTVLAQSPAEGTTLKAGRSITLTIAKKAPPKPKQWLTIKTFQGASSTKTPEFTIPSGAKAPLTYSMPEDSSNIIELYRASDNDLPEDLLLNDIGPQNGTTGGMTPAPSSST
jgi:hypothetical protein